MLHTIPLGIVSSTAAAYLIEKSLLFDGTGFLNRTPSSAGNRKTWTFSVWFKTTVAGATQFFLSAGADANNHTRLQYQSTGTIQYIHFDGGSLTDQLQTSAQLLDASAWYHMVVSVDTTQGTDTNRVKIYINGTAQSFQTTNYPTQNFDTDFNNTNVHRIGTVTGSSNEFEGLMALPILVDGSALAPTAFGETDGDGFWNPIEYTGSFGTNGGAYDFEDTTEFGKDVSATRTALAANYVTAVSNNGGGGFASSPVTFSSVDIGTASANRKVIVGVGIDGYQGNEAYTSLTIGGVAANLIQEQNAASGGRPVALYELDVSSGTSADIVVTFTGTQTKCYSMGIGVWTIESGSVFDTVGSTADPGAGNISVSSGGAVIAIMTEGNANATYTWANLTENFDNQVRASRQAFSGASKSLSSATTQAISANVSGGSQFAMLAASFAPGNDYVANNFTAADQLEDSPTDSAADGIGNFSTLNPNFKQGTSTLSEGNLKIASSSGWGGFAGTVGMDSGKYYWEQSHVGTVAGNFNMGVCRAGVGSSTSITGNAFVAVYEAANNFRANGSNSGNFTPSVTTDCIIGWAYDADARKLWMAVDNTFVNLASAGTGNPATGANPTATISGTDSVFPIGQIYNASGSKYAEYNFGQKAFAYTAPTGFVALATQNLPVGEPLYTGNATQYREDAPLDGIRHTANDFDGASGGDTASFSFTSQSFGEAASDRYILVAASGRKSGGTGTNAGVASMTIGGVSAAQIVTSTSNSANIIQLWGAAVPSGTSGTIAITWNDAQNKCGIGVYKMTGRNTTAITTISSTAAPLTSGAQFLNSRASLIGAAYTGVTATATWANATEDYDTSHGGESWSQSGAVNNGVGSRPITTTCTWASSDAPGAVFAIFKAS